MEIDSGEYVEEAGHSFYGYFSILLPNEIENADYRDKKVAP